MGLISAITPSIDEPTPVDGPYKDPGNPIKDVAVAGDRARAWIFEWPIILASIATLYDKTFIDPSGGWSLGDYILVFAISFGVKKVAVDARWGL